MSNNINLLLHWRSKAPNECLVDYTALLTRSKPGTFTHLTCYDKPNPNPNLIATLHSTFYMLHILIDCSSFARCTDRKDLPILHRHFQINYCKLCKVKTCTEGTTNLPAIPLTNNPNSNSSPNPTYRFLCTPVGL